ncbi:DNA-formamidopyrimidine glycosylase family protein [Patulibacter americanus]|uniref:DNA-formamidopyrimidine glycosylase family protein n=1 Tax=Patulibacter americanus TaxID=588672 RepID=UPI0003B67C52|nr:DNA-formamidopyrimidine glycosylase family protein [Patulibacter americanus]
MPELPEVEITARLMTAALAGATVDSARAPGLATMQTFRPPLDALAGGTLERVDRRGKLLLLRFAGGGLTDDEHPDGRATLIVHLMSAGRLQLFDKRATMKDRTARIVIRLNGGADGHEGERELRLKEFGTRQSAWGRLLRDDDVESDETIATLGPEAWPEPPLLRSAAEADANADGGYDEDRGPGVLVLPPRRTLRGALRDQRVIAGIGRRWADEILWEAKLAPLRRCGDLDEEELTRLRAAIVVRLDGGITRYAADLKLPLKDKFPVPEQVHGHAGDPCPRCGTTILAVHYESDEMAYCPHCQTGDKPYKDRRFSRLLKD